VSEEKRHPPSQKRRDEARARGEVAVSPALQGAMALTAAVATIVLSAGSAGARLIDFARHGFGGGVEPGALLDEAGRVFAWCAGPPLIAALAAAIAIGMVQTRGLITARPLFPTAPRRRPGEGVARPLAFAATAAAATAIALRLELDLAQRAVGAPGSWLLSATAAALGRIALRVGVVMVLAGLVDYAVRRARLERSLRMTRAEAEQERREEEGDPRLAAERRRRHRALSGSRLAEQVALSSVIVAAEGAAAGLRSDGNRLLVAAAGERLIAARIVDLARRLGVPVRFDVDLAPRLGPLAAGDAVPPPLTARSWELIGSLQT
jgi:flagellar biosynthesis protein FlhB